MAPAPILGQAAFYKQYGNKFGKPGSGAYTRYVRYLRRARTPAPPAAHPGGGGPPPAPGGSMFANAQALVNKALAPIIAQTNTQYDTQTAAQQAAIAHATDQYKAAVAQYGPQTAAAYQRAEGAQSGSDAALANLLQGAGTQGATDLAAQLNAPAGSEAAASLQAVGRGAASTSYASGSADLGKLISQGASESAYGARLPGLAALTGYQDTRSMIADMGRKRAADLLAIRTQGPQQALTLYSNALAAKQQMDMAKASGLIDVKTATIKAKTTAQTLNERIRHDQATEANTTASIQQRRQATADRIQAQKDLARIRNQGKTNTASAKRDTAFWKTRASVFKAAVSLYGPGPGGATSGGASGFGAPTGTGSQKKHIPRKDAFNQLWNQYGLPLIHTHKYSPAAVRTMINKALAAAHYVTPRAPRGPGTTTSGADTPGPHSYGG